MTTVTLDDLAEFGVVVHQGFSFDHPRLEKLLRVPVYQNAGGGLTDVDPVPTRWPCFNAFPHKAFHEIVSVV